MKKVKSISEIGELAFIRGIARDFVPQNKIAKLGIGDDAAIIGAGKFDYVVTTDMLVEGTHFSFDSISAHALGVKSVAVNLSDIAAMGAQPQFMFISIGMPKNASAKLLFDFYSGLKSEALRYGVDLLGGDTVGSEKWVISITLAGKRKAQPKNRLSALRSNLKEGALIYSTGFLGDSGAGLRLLSDKNLKRLRGKKYAGHLIERHLLPTPRVKAGEHLFASLPDLTMIDVSDGLYNESNLLSEASRVGIEISLSSLPLSCSLLEFCDDAGLSPVDFALFGGEDYELLFATKRVFSGAELKNLERKIGVCVTQIGRAAKGGGVRFLDDAGRCVNFENKTFRHF